jgi:hypothetical protein
MFLRPLMEEMKELWQCVDAYDNHLKYRFNLCVAYLWSNHDYLTYDIFADWSVHGRLSCPIYMDDSNAFILQHGRKVTLFDCHPRFLPLNHPFWRGRWSFLKGKTVRKGSPKQKLGADITKMLDDFKESENAGFEGYSENQNWTHKSWRWELPYAKDLILPHNIDLIHHERNVTKSIISMCFDFTGFMKDNMNTRRDLANICDHTSLEARANPRGNLTRPRAPYYFKPKERKKMIKWLKTLKFLDCYTANIKRAVNISTGKLNGLKNHDYHIIMERLMSVIFCGYLNVNLWKAFTELSYFYMQICAKEVSKAMMQKLEKEIMLLVCKMEKVFPPGAGWFNVIQHLLVHLPWEARVGGHIQFRCMYIQERELKKLKAMVHNKARVEGCIVDTFVCKEIMNFSNMYFSCVNNMNAHTTRYHVVEEVSLSELKIF